MSGLTEFDRAIAAGYEPMPGEWAEEMSKQAQEVHVSISKDFFDDLDGHMEKAEKESEGGDAWSPDSGETLKGIFLNVQFVKGKWGWNPVGVVRDIKTEESVTVWFSPSILKERMLSLKPAPGAPIAIRFDGEEKSEKTGNMYKKHTVAMPDRDEGDVILGREYWAEQETEAKAKEAAKQEERVEAQANRPDEAPF